MNSIFYYREINDYKIVVNPMAKESFFSLNIYEVFMQYRLHQSLYIETYMYTSIMKTTSEYFN